MKQVFVATLVATLLLSGCSGSGNHGTAISAQQPQLTQPGPTPPTAQGVTVNASNFYDLAAVTTQVVGPVGQLVGPIAVVVTQNGQPVDGITVMFEAQAPQFGPWGLGSTTSGFNYWQIAQPGTGIAAVGGIPAQVGSVFVVVVVVPTVSSVPTPPATSNQVLVEVVGQ